MATEYPKWLHKDWKPTEGKQGPGHHEPGQSKLVQGPEEAKELLSKGWTEAPSQKSESAPAAEPETKKEAGPVELKAVPKAKKD